MALDPNIIAGIRPVQIDSPVNALAQVLKVQGLQQDAQLGQAKLDEYTRTKARQNKLLNLVQSLPAGTTDDQRIDALKGGGYFDEADKLQTGMVNRRKVEAEAKAKEWDAQAKKLDLAGQAFGYVRQNPTLEAANQVLDYLGQQGVYSPETVAQYKATVASDPSKIASLADTAFRTVLGAKEQLMKVDTRNLGGTTQTIGTDPLTGRTAVLSTATNTQSPDNAATNATTRRGQDLTDARARELGQQGQYDADRGVLVDKHTGVARPVVGADGKSLQAGGKMTEDQAKATGWLVQAENAWKNMQAVGMGKDGKPTDAAKPGRIETALSASLPFGAGEAAANSWRGADRQKFLQGASSLSEALLRAATGAGVNKDEAAQKVRELTPVWGDTNENIQQKMDSIPLYIESLKVRSGPGAAKAATVLSKPSGAATVPDDIAVLLKKHGGK